MTTILLRPFIRDIVNQFIWIIFQLNLVFYLRWKEIMF